MPTETVQPVDPLALSETLGAVTEQLCDLIAEARDSIAELRALSARPLVSGLYSISEAAARLGLSPSQAYALIADERWPETIEVLRLGMTYRIRVSEVEAYLAPRQAAE